MWNKGSEHKNLSSISRKQGNKLKTYKLLQKYGSDFPWASSDFIVFLQNQHAWIWATSILQKTGIKNNFFLISPPSISFGNLESSWADWEGVGKEREKLICFARVVQENQTVLSCHKEIPNQNGTQLIVKVIIIQ